MFSFTTWYNLNILSISFDRFLLWICDFWINISYVLIESVTLFPLHQVEGQVEWIVKGSVRSPEMFPPFWYVSKVETCVIVSIPVKGRKDNVLMNPIRCWSEWTMSNLTALNRFFQQQLSNGYNFFPGTTLFLSFSVTSWLLFQSWKHIQFNSKNVEFSC